MERYRLTIADEKAAQAGERRALQVCIWGGVILAALLAVNGHGYIAAFVLFVVVPATVLRLWNREKEWAYRLAVIAFKQQVLNLYIYANSPDDTEVHERAVNALELLKIAGNTHGVKVWYMPFGSPYFFSYTLNGKEVQQGRHQVEKEIVHDFGAYQTAVEAFYIQDDFRRRLELSKGNTSKTTDWLSQFVLNQN